VAIPWIKRLWCVLKKVIIIGSMIPMIKEQKSKEINNMSIKFYHPVALMNKVSFILANSTSIRDTEVPYLAIVQSNHFSLVSCLDHRMVIIYVQSLVICNLIIKTNTKK
jgi:hypothetical protein